MVENAEKIHAIPKHPAAWALKRLDTICYLLSDLSTISQFIKPQGKLNLIMSANRALNKGLGNIMNKRLPV
jgi:hypothetical protein